MISMIHNPLPRCRRGGAMAGGRSGACALGGVAGIATGVLGVATGVAGIATALGCVIAARIASSVVGGAPCGGGASYTAGCTTGADSGTGATLPASAPSGCGVLPATTAAGSLATSSATSYTRALVAGGDADSVAIVSGAASAATAGSDSAIGSVMDAVGGTVSIVAVFASSRSQAGTSP